MTRIILWILGAFLMCGALGYQTGSRIASRPYRLATYVASRTQVHLDGDEIVMSFLGENQSVYWTYNLEKKFSQFENRTALQNSLRSRSINAESEWLLNFIGGGAALTVTGPQIIKSFTKQSKGDLRVKIAQIIGGATGFALGYWLGVKSIDFNSPEILSYIRKEENIEWIKKLVFTSMVLKDDFQPVKVNENIKEPDCPDGSSRVECIWNSPRIKDFEERLKIQFAIKNSAIKKISKDGQHLEGYEFIIFFM